MNEERIAAASNRVAHSAWLVCFLYKEFIMAKMTKNQLIDAIAEATQVSKGDVKAVIEQMTTVGYKELNELASLLSRDLSKCQS